MVGGFNKLVPPISAYLNTTDKSGGSSSNSCNYNDNDNDHDSADGSKLIS